AAPRQADVAVVGDRIAYVGADAASRFRVRRSLDVQGLVVAPGFIDPHTHPDRYIRSDDAGERLNAPWLFQGVTTIFIGSDGSGSPDIARQRAWFAEHGVGTNLAMYVGFGAVRSRVLGQDAAAPDAGQLQQMRAMVADGMCEGAVALPRPAQPRRARPGRGTWLHRSAYASGPLHTLRRRRRAPQRAVAVPGRDRDLHRRGRLAVARRRPADRVVRRTRRGHQPGDVRRLRRGALARARAGRRRAGRR